MDSDSSSSSATPRSRESSHGLSCLITAGLGLVFLVLLFVPILQSARTIRRGPRGTCANNMRNLAVALLEYQDAHGCLPPACIYDAQGRPMHSWRVLILPYLEHTALFRQYDFAQPWNSPKNWALVGAINPFEFRCPQAQGEPGETNYLAVVGKDTVWPKGMTGGVAGHP